MSTGGASPPERVPTLTEVVAWPPAQAPQRGGLPLTDERPAEADMLGTPAAPLRVVDDALVQSVLVEVQRQVELMLEYRLREALTPLLNRAADAIVREARTELASSLRDVVARAVAQELARHRTR